MTTKNQISPRTLANAIRFLSIDAIQKANSGHPGMPLGMADIATVLWREYLQHNPADPHWINRDRFILSNGHGSMLQYSLLHLTGYDLSLDDIKNFRQLHSKTPGHPEVGLTPGIETTTGPLGQGLANSVGMALAEKMLAAQFNRPGFKIIDNFTYVFVGDGCLMEGLSHEVCALAGTHGLGKLIVFWDNNQISIDGNVSGWFTEDTVKRFLAYGWHVVPDVDGHSSDEVHRAIALARSANNQPSLICCKTIIGYGAPNLCGSHDCHGSPLGVEEISETRKNLDWNYGPFEIPPEIKEAWDFRSQGKALQEAWQDLFNQYQAQFPDLAKELLRRTKHALPENWNIEATKILDKISKNTASFATRQSSQKCINEFAPVLPEFFGGSADLTASNLTDWANSKDLTYAFALGNYLHYGVREFGMFAIMNGIALYGGFLPFGGTFLVFASYGHSAIRMASLMKQRVIYVLSHDSIGLGEDGPTHQPIEQLAMLRNTPNLSLWRPADCYETAIAWKSAIENLHGPTCLILTRQKLPELPRSAKMLTAVQKGGYVIFDADGEPDYIIIATGSEVTLAIGAAKKLKEFGKNVRVVSMPAEDVFAKQDESYREAVLPKAIKKRIAIEAGAPDFWYKYVGLAGKVIGINRYGESAPAKALFELFGLTEEKIVKTINEM